MSVMAGTPYAQLMPFDPSWSLSAYTAGYEFYRSPNTSGGSDESMNSSQIDQKKSPKYLEKRRKNNEAAKKSRKQRKEREMNYQKENIALKEELAKVREDRDNLTMQLQRITVTTQGLIEENDELKRKLAQFQHNPLRDVTNVRNGTTYAAL